MSLLISNFPQGAERRNRKGKGKNGVFAVLLDMATEMLKMTILFTCLGSSKHWFFFLEGLGLEFFLKI